MQSNSTNCSSEENSRSADTPPSPLAPPPAVGIPPLIGVAAPRPQPDQRSGALRLRPLVTLLLSLGLGLFLADGVVSLLDDSLMLFFGVHGLAMIRALAALPVMLLALLIYGLMALTPLVPKRLFLPLSLFIPAAMLAMVPVTIYAYGWLAQAAWLLSLAQVGLGLFILCRAQGRFTLRWPLVPEHCLGHRAFGWRNFAVFLLVNVFGVLPAIATYLGLCAVLAVNHLSDGFLSLRPSGLIVQVRKYVRDDGKTVQLFPMAHVGDRNFYRALSEAFQTNSTILMEGVTDHQNLLTNKITYKRMATTLGLSEQQAEFNPARGEMVHADVDVEVFAPDTIDFMNLVMLVHAKGAKPANVAKLMQYSPPPDFLERLLADVLHKRNRRLLEEIQDRLPDAEHIVVPWGAAHMPQIAREIQTFGFRLDETREYTVIRFGSKRDRRQGNQPENDGRGK